MRGKRIVVFSLLAFAAAAQEQDKRLVELNGGLTAQLLSLGRDTSGRPTITAAVKIANTGKDYVFLMVYGSISAIDEGGVKFEPPGDAVSGIAWCETSPAERCIGIPSGSNAFPIQQYTEIDPGKAVTAHLRLVAPTGSKSVGRVSIVTQIGYRVVKEVDIQNDDVLSDTQRIKQVRTGSISFEPIPATER